MRTTSILLLLLVACNAGEISNPTFNEPIWSRGDSNERQGESKVPITPFVTKTEGNSDAGDASDASDAGSDAPVDAGLDTSTDAGLDCSTEDASVDADTSDAGALTCESGTTVVGHCLFNMATACQEYFSDHSAECKDLQVHPMGGSWWAGPCGGEPGTDLVRSTGGCKDECGSIQWAYRLGGYPPDDVSRQGWKDTCEAWPGRTYLPVP